MVCAYCFKLCIAYCTSQVWNWKGSVTKKAFLKNCWKNSVFPLVVYVYMIFRVAVLVIDRRVSHFTRSIGQYPLHSVHTEQVQCPFGKVCSTVYSLLHFRKSDFLGNASAGRSCSGSTQWSCSREGHLALVSASTRTGRTLFTSSPRGSDMSLLVSLVYESSCHDNLSE